MTDFAGLPKNHYGAILADPPWAFEVWYAGGWRNRPDGSRVYHPPTSRGAKYDTMATEDIAAMPVAELAAKNSVLFLWGCWPMLRQSLQVIDGWNFTHKSCAFVWMKGDMRQIEMFRDDFEPDMRMGYWTRANTEFCLLGTRGKPKRLAADVRQAILSPRREHSRKPDCVHERIERLVAGPYLELFARTRREGWDAWGNEIDKFAPSKGRVA